MSSIRILELGENSVHKIVQILGIKALQVNRSDLENDSDNESQSRQPTRRIFLSDVRCSKNLQTTLRMLYGYELLTGVTFWNDDFGSNLDVVAISVHEKSSGDSQGALLLLVK